MSPILNYKLLKLVSFLFTEIQGRTRKIESVCFLLTASLTPWMKRLSVVHSSNTPVTEGNQQEKSLRYDTHWKELQLPVWKRNPTERNKNVKGYTSIYHLIRMLYISLNYDPFFPSHIKIISSRIVYNVSITICNISRILLSIYTLYCHS